MQLGLAAEVYGGSSSSALGYFNRNERVLASPRVVRWRESRVGSSGA